MPSKSAKQKRFMAMSANRKARRKMKKPAPMKVAKEYVEADEGRGYKKMGSAR